VRAERAVLALRDAVEARDAWHRRHDKLLAALKAVVETDDDCPMCDRGRLRNPQKSHWPECPFGRAQAVIANAEGLV